MKRKASILLVLVLWLMCIFALFAAGLYRLAAGQITVTRHLEGSVLADNAAQSILAYIRACIRNNPGFSGMSKTGDLGDVHFEYTVSDEESRINLNYASETVISRLNGFTAVTAKAVSGSAFKPFKAKETLLLVEGLTPEILSGAQDLITVHSCGKVNINTAGKDVLVALDVPIEAIDAVIMPFRVGPDNKTGTSDDGVFSSAEQAITTIRQNLGETIGGKVQALFAQQALDVKSQTFRVKLVTKVFAKPLREYDIIFNLEKLLSWREQSADALGGQ